MTNWEPKQFIDNPVILAAFIRDAKKRLRSLKGKADIKTYMSTGDWEYLQEQLSDKELEALKVAWCKDEPNGKQI